MMTRVKVGIIGAVLFILGFLALLGAPYDSPYRNLYIAMTSIGILLVLGVKLVGWLER